MKNILLVEDNESLRIGLKEYLGRSGFNIHVAQNGQEALDMLEKNNFDLIVTDLIMPVMSGDQLIDKVLALNTFKGKIILLSALDSNVEIADALKKGVSQYLVKSKVSLKEIAAIVDQVINRNH